ncbi:MAG: GNAT family N-acetyltransferase [Oceanisphaera sp.]|uniref:GNAT family N-acetyltransferase n=1 Tax=Oceanisphaera sp. TaxID=1929979 RepID=UPI003F96ED0C
MYQLVEIQAQHNADMSRIIKQVGAEFGAVGDGFGPGDPEVLCMSEHYLLANRSRYIVALVNDQAVGGAGIAPIQHNGDTCELKKLFLLPQYRGHGIGLALTQACLVFAQQQGYQACYLDTLANMTAAIRLYESVGFNHLTQPIAGSIHGGCDVWMLKTLNRDTPPAILP